MDIPYAQQAGAIQGIASRPAALGAQINTEQRFRCLDLAIRCAQPDPVKLASEFYDFVTGKTVADRVADALKTADAG